MVTNYSPNNCNYIYSKLDSVVYLIDEESLRDIRIDNGEAYINDITQDPLELHVYGISLQDTSNLDERYAFTHSLTFSMNGYASHQDLNGKYYVIVKTTTNEYWLVNPMFPSKVTYTYTLDGVHSSTNFTLATISNFPTLRVHEMSQTRTYECGYVYCTLDSLRLNETNYSLHLGNHVVYTNDGFKDIVYNKKSAVFTETFDGDNVQHSLTFNIKFSDYKDSWHYNLLEFVDNKYAAIIKTSCGKYILLGFNFGFQPSFTVNASDDMTMDYIEISMRDLHDNGTFIVYDDDITLEKDGTLNYEFDEYGAECIGLNTAKYLLKREQDMLHNPTGRYLVLSGYEDRFPNLDIIGTFDEITTFTNYSCSGYCLYHTDMPSQIVFYNQYESKQFSFNADSDWSITSSESWITVSPSSGVANSSYTITVTNNAEPRQSALRAELTLSFCSKTVKFYVVVTQSTNCLPLGDTYEIGIEGGQLTIPTNCCIQSVSAMCCVSRVQIQDGYVTMMVDANTTTETVYIPLVLTKCDGSTINATIIQAHYYTRWVYLGRKCVSNEWCKVERMYSGETADNVNTPTDITRYTDCVESDICREPVYKWENIDPSEDYYCNDCSVERYKWENIDPLLDYYCNDCPSGVIYKWENVDPTQDWYCNDCVREYRWENIDPTEDYYCNDCPQAIFEWRRISPSVDFWCDDCSATYEWRRITPTSNPSSYWCDDCSATYEWRRITPTSNPSSYWCEDCS